MKMRKVLMVFSLFSLFSGSLAAQSVKDIEGNIYLTTVIGKQVWMAENLKTTKFNDGTPIPLVTEDKIWKGLKKPAYCWFNNDIENKDVYGALYNWYTVSIKKLCPKGWHESTDADWKTLMSFIGDQELAGDKLKEAGDEHWKNSLDQATDEYEFTALPGGMRHYDGMFPTFGSSYAVWWTSTPFNDKTAWNCGLYFSSSKLYHGYDFKENGFSVRCVKD